MTQREREQAEREQRISKPKSREGSTPNKGEGLVGSWNLIPLWRPRLGELLLTAIPLIAALISYTQFAIWVESRDGFQFTDPILTLLPSFDLTWPIFTVIYCGILASIFQLIRYPNYLLHALRAYALLLFIRICAMYLLPLLPPEGMIVLIDPVAGLGPGGALERDLFFSGHTATMTLLTLAVRGRLLTSIFALLTLLLAIMLLLQHVHYSIDILAAPFFAWGAWRMTGMRAEG